MSANRQPGYDPKLKVAAKEIRAVLEKHQVAGSISLASDTHAETCIYFPRWSMIQIKGEAISIGLRAKEPERSNSSMFLLLGLRDACTEHALSLTKVSEHLIAAVEAKGGEVTHEKFKDWVAENWEKQDSKQL